MDKQQMEQMLQDPEMMRLLMLSALISLLMYLSQALSIYLVLTKIPKEQRTMNKWLAFLMLIPVLNLIIIFFLNHFMFKALFRLEVPGLTHKYLNFTYNLGMAFGICGILMLVPALSNIFSFLWIMGLVIYLFQLSKISILLKNKNAIE